MVKKNISVFSGSYSCCSCLDIRTYSHKEVCSEGHESETFTRWSNIAKLTSMLEPYGLTGRLLTVPEDMPDVFDEQINYNDVNSCLENLRSGTVEYIKMILNE